MKFYLSLFLRVQDKNDYGLEKIMPSLRFLKIFYFLFFGTLVGLVLNISFITKANAQTSISSGSSDHKSSEKSLKEEALSEELLTPKISTVRPPQNGSEIIKEEESLLQRHLPFYFAYGRPLSKLQVSMKTPIVRTWPIYFAYTQVMFWDLGGDSKPFRDFTYNPELFYRWVNPYGQYLTSIDMGLYGHNSNGKSGPDTRSIDKQYLRFNWNKPGQKWVTRVSAQLSYMHNFDNENKDYVEYVSPLTLRLSFVQLFDSWIDKSEFSVSATPGGKYANDWDRGGYEISSSFRFSGLQLTPAFYIQYYQGYAETLLNYNKKVNELRAGFIF